MKIPPISWLIPVGKQLCRQLYKFERPLVDSSHHAQVQHNRIGSLKPARQTRKFGELKHTVVMATPKIVLVTGGNSGIGYEAVKALMQSDKPYHILLGSRSSEKGKLAIETLHAECPDSNNTVEAIQVDLTSDESIEKAFKQVQTNPGHLDVLINNAGPHPSPAHPPIPSPNIN